MDCNAPSFIAIYSLYLWNGLNQPELLSAGHPSHLHSLHQSSQSCRLLPSSVFLYCKVMSKLPLRYRKIRFTAVKWASDGFELNFDTTPTAWEMSGLVATAAYSKLPTIDWYITESTALLYNILSSFRNLTFESAGVETGLACIFQASSEDTDFGASQEYFQPCRQ